MILRALFPTAVAVALALAACDGAERRDAETVLLAVGRFRTADHASTSSAVAALRATPCEVPDACRTRDTCAAVGEETARALRLKGEVQRGLDALEKGTLAKDSAEAKALPSKLDEAETLLKKGHEGLAGCDELVQALKRKYRI